jgi:membrane associated rhomboid family serine protease
MRSDVAYATYTFLGLNVLVFLAELLGGGGPGSVEAGGSLIREGGLFGPAISDGGEWYRIFTSGFLHANLIHLLFNMYVLYILGTLLEPAVGAARMVGIYVVSLVAGSFGALLLTPDALTVGASGAVYGIMAATFLIARRRGVDQITTLIGFWVVLNLAFTFAVPGISVGGHIGGLVGGGLAALVVIGCEKRIPRDQRTIVETLAISAIGVIALVGALIAAGQTGGGVLG